MSDNVIKWEDIQNNPDAIKIGKHGFVYLKSVYGEDDTIAEAARISYGKGTKTVLENKNLIRYLIRNAHTSPVEQVSATFIIKLPLFIMGQLVRHRTAKLNQYSGRYSVMPDEYFTPEKWRSQSKTNKQGGEEEIEYDPDSIVKYQGENFYTAEEYSFLEYNRRLENGVSRELARTCLPQSTYTITVWQMDLHNLSHFLKLRMDAHAQKEIREYAEAIYQLIKKKFPIACQAFEDYKFKAKTFSRMEVEILKKICDISKITDDMYCEMSEREKKEFIAKLS